MAAGQDPSDVVSINALAVEMGLITQHEAQLADSRRDSLKRGGIKLTPCQTLVERKYLAPFQVRVLMREFEKRVKALGLNGNSMASVPPRMLGQYELLEMISEKTHSRIIRARDTVMNRPVVLKILPSSLKSDPQWSERFRRETMLLGKMAHPNLVQAYAATEIDGNPVIAMEYVEGSTVGDRIEHEGSLPEKETWLIAREVAKALGYANRAGVIHRDIKPDNIVCSRGGKVKLIDMGFSKSLTDTTHLTVEGTTVGTPFYISPEQAKGTRDLDARTDIYSLGCTVFHMVTGAPPFWGDEITEVMLKHIEAKRPDPRSILPEISAGSAELIMRMMATKPDKRPPSADILVEEITALLPKLPKLFGAASVSQPAPPQSSGVQRIPAKSSERIMAPPIVQEYSFEKEYNARVNRNAKQSIWQRIRNWFGG